MNYIKTLIRNLDISIQEENKAVIALNLRDFDELTFGGRNKELHDELTEAEQARENAERNLITEMSDEYFNNETDYGRMKGTEMAVTYEDCIDHAATQVGKIAWRIEQRINNYLNNINYELLN